MTARSVVAVLAILAGAVAPRTAVAHEESGSFVREARAVAVAIGPVADAINEVTEGDSGLQRHDHPFHVRSRRGPVVVAGIVRIDALTVEAGSDRIGGAAETFARVTATGVTLFEGTPDEVHAEAITSRVRLACVGGSRGLYDYGSDIVNLNSASVSLPAQNLNPVRGVEVATNQLQWLGNGARQTGLIVSTPSGTIRIAEATATIPACPASLDRDPAEPVKLTTATRARGIGTIDDSIPCSEGGTGSFAHATFDGAFTPASVHAGSGALSAGTMTAFVDAHSSDLGAGRAYLLGEQTRVVIDTARGSLTLALSSGSCATPTLTRTAEQVSGTGTWRVIAGDTSFDQAQGSGTFAMTASTHQGAGNTLDLTLDGAVSILRPQLTFDASTLSSTPQGVAPGRAAGSITVANAGPGDAYGIRLDSVSGEAAAAAGTSHADDLRAGAQETVPLDLFLSAAPCLPGCTRNAELRFVYQDAFGRPRSVMTLESLAVGSVTP